jgi:hypothetical protein
MGVFCSTTRSGWVASPQLTAWGAGGGDGKGPSRGCVTSFIFLLPELFVLRAAVRFISGTFLRSLSVCLSVSLQDEGDVQIGPGIYQIPLWVTLPKQSEVRKHTFLWVHSYIKPINLPRQAWWPDDKVEGS